MSSELISQFEVLIRRDPARRGLISSEAEFGPLCGGHLASAAAHLAGHGRGVAIVTGFYIPKGTPPAAETDGPPGSLFLAKALHDSGIPTTVITDAPCHAACCAAAKALEFPQSEVLACPLEEQQGLPRVGPSVQGQGDCRCFPW